MTTSKFLRWMYSTRRMDERVVTSGEVLDWHRGEDVRDLKRSELNELVEKLTCLNALEEKIWKIDWKRNRKIVMDDKINPKIGMDGELVQNVVMDEELVQNRVMDENFVKNFVMDAKIDPKVVRNLFMFKIGGWNILQPSNRKLSEELDENEPRLLIRIPSRDSFLMIQYLERHFASGDPNVKELMPLCEGLHEMQCYRRQHLAACNDLHEHPRRHSSWKESTRMKFMNIQMEYSKRRSWKTAGAFKNSWRIKNSLGELL